MLTFELKRIQDSELEIVHGGYWGVLSLVAFWLADNIRDIEAGFKEGQSAVRNNI